MRLCCFIRQLCTNTLSSKPKRSNHDVRVVDEAYFRGKEMRRKHGISKQVMRDETERLVKEAIERKTVAVKQGKTRIDAICGKCGAPNRVLAAPGQVRVAYTCKQCGDKQKTL